MIFLLLSLSLSHFWPKLFGYSGFLSYLCRE